MISVVFVEFVVICYDKIRYNNKLILDFNIELDHYYFLYKILFSQYLPIRKRNIKKIKCSIETYT